MFKKPFTSSSSPTLLRSSDSRRLILEIATAFSCQAGLINGWLDNKGFLVEQCRSHLDERFTLYSAAATNDPWCFRVDSTLFPSVYFLDLLASSSPLPFPCLVTNTTVLSNLISGSNLFSQGVSLHSIESLEERTAVVGTLSIIEVDHDDRTTSVEGIGYLAQSKRDLLSRETKGIAIQTIHCRNDHLWKHGSEKISSNPTVVDHISKLNIAEPDQEEQRDVAVPPSDAVPAASTLTTESEPTPTEVDQMLKTAVLRTIHSGKSALSFPLPASAFYASILKYRPVEMEKYDLKKSSFKKLAAFLKFVVTEETKEKKGEEKDKILVLKEVRGELMVMSVNVDHPLVQNVQRLRSKTVGEVASTSSSSATPAAAAASAVASSTSPSASSTVVIDYLKPDATIDLLLQSISNRPGKQYYLPSELKALFNTYLTANHLLHPKDHHYFLLDQTLSDAIVKKEERIEMMRREEGVERMVARCDEAHSMRFGAGEEIFAKGPSPKIQIRLKTVGKRMVTLITNLEPFRISADVFAAELKTAAAASCSVSLLPGSGKKKGDRWEVLLQGSMSVLVRKELEKRGVRKECVVELKK